MPFSFDKTITLGSIITMAIYLITMVGAASAVMVTQQQQAEMLLKHNERIALVEVVTADYLAFKGGEPRFDTDSATILKNQAVSEAVGISTVQNDKVVAELKSQSAQLTELKVMLAGIQATLRETQR